MNSSRADSHVNCLKTSDVSKTHSVSILRDGGWRRNVSLKRRRFLNNWHGCQPEKSSYNFVAVKAWRHIFLALFHLLNYCLVCMFLSFVRPFFDPQSLRKLLHSCISNEKFSVADEIYRSRIMVFFNLSNMKTCGQYIMIFTVTGWTA
jgi:hypothetical protein